MYGKNQNTIFTLRMASKLILSLLLYCSSTYLSFENIMNQTTLNNSNHHILSENDLTFTIVNKYKKVIFEYRYEPAYKLAVHVWHGFIDDNTIIEIYKFTAQFGFQRKQFVFGSITDLQDIEGSFDGTNEWLTKEYIPIAVKYGFRFATTIRSKDFFANLALEELEALGVGYTNKIFDSFEEGYAWITEQLSKIQS